MPHILLVEDEVKIATLVALDLSDAGYRVTVAHDGITAWEQTQRHAPDMIVLDWKLPQLTGLELCTRLRASGRTMPIIFATAWEDQEHRTIALKAGANDYLVKPFGTDMLLTKIADHLRTVSEPPFPQI